MGKVHGREAVGPPWQSHRYSKLIGATCRHNLSSAAFGSHEKIVVTCFERTSFCSRLHRDICTCHMPNHLDTSRQDLPYLLHLSAGTGCDTAKSLGISSCSGRGQYWWAFNILSLVLSSPIETVRLWMARLCNPTAQGSSSSRVPFQFCSGCRAWQPNNAPLPDQRFKPNKIHQALLVGTSHVALSHTFSRGFFARRGFAQPSCSGDGSRRQESQRCQRCQGESIWKLPGRSWGFWDVAAVEWLAKAAPVSREFSWFANLAQYGLCQQIVL